MRCENKPLLQDDPGFLQEITSIAVAFPGLASALPAASSDDSDTIVGPKKGYSPQIGTLTSMMGFMRSQVYASTKGMSVQGLDFLLDEKANRIGALLLHLVATETYYQLAIFEGMKWGSWPESSPRKSEDHFFWSGVGKLESIVRSWQRRLRRLFQLAGLLGFQLSGFQFCSGTRVRG